MALEREKIAKGMQCTKVDEIRLKELLKLQMEEKKRIEMEEEDLDMMWHQVLLEDVRRKEERDRLEAQKRQQEMFDRRRAYDEQIASANRKRDEAIREEREKENAKLEKMKKKMEQDHYEAIKKKKDQQKANKISYMEGHEMKVSRLQSEKLKEREIDNGTILVALEELRREKERQIRNMQSLQLEKKICTENFELEKRTALQIETESDRIAQEWQLQKESKTDDYLRRIEDEKRCNKERAAQDYKRHLEIRNQELDQEKRERCIKMEKVKSTAFRELQKRLDSANDELKRQIDYRNNLNRQIKDNQRIMETESYEIDIKDRPFTKRADMFRSIMEKKFDSSPGRTSTNPVHPFRRLMETKEEKIPIQLPVIGKCVYKYS